MRDGKGQANGGHSLYVYRTHLLYCLSVCLILSVAGLASGQNRTACAQDRLDSRSQEQPLKQAESTQPEGKQQVGTEVLPGTRGKSNNAAKQNGKKRYFFHSPMLLRVSDYVNARIPSCLNISTPDAHYLVPEHRSTRIPERQFSTGGADDKTKPKSESDAQEPAEAEPDLINADRPGIADGSQVVGPRRFQIEVGIEEDYLGGGNSTARLLTIPVLLRYGIDGRYELRIETSGYSDLSTTDPTNGTQHTQGGAPISIGFKRQFAASKGAHHPGFGTIVRLFPGSGGGAFRSNHATGDVRLAVDWDFAPKLSLNPNIGVGVSEDNGGRLYGNFQFANTLTYAPTTHLGFFIDAGLQTPEEAGGADALIYDGGVTYILGSNVQLDVAVGSGAKGRSTPHPFWTAGVSVRF